MDRGDGSAPERGAAPVTAGHDPQVTPVVTGSGVGRQGKAAVWRPGSRWKFVPVAAAMAAVAVLYEAWIFFRFGGARLTVAVDDVGLAGVVAVAAVLTALRARRSVDPGARRGWLLLSASCAAWAAGQAIYSVYELLLGNPSPFPSLADVGYLGATCLQIVAVLVLRGPTWGRSRVRPLLDGAIVAGALLLVSWLTVMRTVYTAGGTDPFTFDLGLAYPIGDVVTMVIVLSALSQTRRLDSSLAVVFAGISVITVTDSIYGYLTATNVYEGANLIDVGWVIGYLLVGLGALIARRPRSSVRAAQPTRWQVLLPYGPVLLVSLIVGANVFRQQDLDSFTESVIAALFGLVLARQLIEMLRSQALATRLQSALRASADTAAEREVLIEHAPVGICRIDREGRLVSVNRTLRTMLGYSEREMVGRSFLHFMHEEDRAHDLPTYVAIAEGRAERFAKENRFKRKDGTVVWCSQVGIAVRGPDGRVESVIGMLDDLTDRKLQTERAAYMQRRLLPQTTPRIPGYELAGACRAAEDVGGDLYDWVVFGDGSVDVTVADVMGKGVSAALVMASLRTALRTSSIELGPAARVSQVAESMALESVDEELFVTMFHGRLDPSSGLLHYVDAGHGHCLIRQSDGALTRLTRRSLPVGVRPNEEFQEGIVELAPGDTLVVYSDGLVETAEEMAGASLVAPEVDPEASAGEVVARLMSRMPTRPPDDVTVLVLRRLPDSSVRRPLGAVVDGRGDVAPLDDNWL